MLKVKKVKKVKKDQNHQKYHKNKYLQKQWKVKNIKKWVIKIHYYLTKIKLIKSYLMIINFLQIQEMLKLTQNLQIMFVHNVNNQLKIDISIFD